MLFSAKDSQGSQSLTLGFTATPLPGLGVDGFRDRMATTKLW